MEDRIRELEGKVNDLERLLFRHIEKAAKQGENLLSLFQTVQRLVIKTTTEFDDDEECRNLRELILADDGGDEMKEFHVSNFIDRMKQINAVEGE